jgi:N-acetylglucosaminyldiphosphoundecaprenol N-acetyl-beta-D-mannosaminyltransferase
MLRTLNILGVNITSESKENILKYLFDRLRTKGEKTFIITPNPEMLVYASKHLDYHDKLNHANIALPDGIGLFFASSFMGERLEERITGVDFIEELCMMSSKLPLSMGFLGGKAGVAERAVKCLQKKYPGIKVVFVGSEWSEQGFMSGKKDQIDILFVAFGVPKQEEWIIQNLPKLPVKTAIGVGGAFDFLSGDIKRAPFILRFLGFEWLFRLIVQPWRWRRQLALIEFISLVFKERSQEK